MLRVCFPFVGDGIGGSHISALALIRELPRFGIKPLVVVHQDGPLASFLKEADVSFRLLRWSKFARANAASYGEDKRLLKAARWRFAWYLRRNRANIVHSNDIRIGCTWLASAALGGARFVWHQRTPGSKHVLNCFVTRADIILCPSMFLRDRIIGSVTIGFLKIEHGWSRILQVNNPITLSPADRLEPMSEEGHPRIGFVANEWPRKRPEFFLATAARVLDTFPNAEFLIAGAFSDTTRRALLAPWPDALTSRVKFLGFVKDRQLLFQHLDLLMAPAVDEGFGRTLVEAMLAGVPVVAAESGGHREIIDHGRTGLLVPPDDAEAFAAAIAALLRNSSLRESLVHAAKIKTSVRYDASAIDRQVADIYRALPPFGIVEQLRRMRSDSRWLTTEEGQPLWP